ncbi:MAG: DNA topoisomerase, partial [Myxococcaceae bacterium]
MARATKKTTAETTPKKKAKATAAGKTAASKGNGKAVKAKAAPEETAPEQTTGKAPRKVKGKKATAAALKGRKKVLAVVEAAADDGDGEEEKPVKKRSRPLSLVVVESPAKAKTIKKYLGPGYQVKASVGHIKDLPKSKIGVDVEKGFKPVYEVVKGKEKVLADIKKIAKVADTVYLATDPDREGEAIAWHIAEEIEHPNAKRVMFNEITKKAIQTAIQHPQALDHHKYDSQQTRRILDRLVGYQISPILWQKVRRGLSAGRVQSVAVRQIVEREAEIKAFVPEEYWTMDAVLAAAGSPPNVRAKLSKLDGKKAEIPNKATAQSLLNELKTQSFVISKIDRRERRRNAPAPFITSKLQQEAANRLHFTAKKTMTLAQRLYEGVPLGEEGQVALITYMRTDSTRLSDDAVA